MLVQSAFAPSAAAGRNNISGNTFDFRLTMTTKHGDGRKVKISSDNFLQNL